MKKTVKIISIILLATMLLGTLTSAAFATVTPGQITANQTTDTGMQNVGSRIFGGIQVFGIVASVVILAILGVKYMMASPDGKAEYKSSMIPYIVGAILIFGASTIANFVYNTVNIASGQ